jgi:hypothetical protein
MQKGSLFHHKKRSPQPYPKSPLHQKPQSFQHQEAVALKPANVPLHQNECGSVQQRPVAYLAIVARLPTDLAVYYTS